MGKRFSEILFDVEYKKYYFNFDNIEEYEKDIVILFHGIYGTLKDMSHIVNYLKNEKYSGMTIQYPTVPDKIEVLTEKYIKPSVENVIGNVKKINEIRVQKGIKLLKINFVVHSLGSVILRYYLKKYPMKELGKVIFISPPSYGSDLADNPISDILKEFIGDAVEQIKTNKNSFVNLLGEPDYPCYVLIGDKSGNPLYSLFINGRDDGMVPVDRAEFKNHKFKIIKNTTHTTILKDQRTFLEIKKYFEK